ncbi:MAG: histidine phosphatase family protein [Leadbetterella sp.]|nr:histidine phosphatase family protein [Leadbetterella sp.]MBP8156025.1 histidine phosphatase family protein [Leadbetterella sp.]
MEKNLLLIRHATAEDVTNSSMVRDRDRELTSRGIMESARIGKYLKDNGFEIDAILCSPATRTHATANLIAEQLKFDTENVEIAEGLYGSGPRGYLALLNGLNESLDTAIIVGHNPDITFFADYLCSQDCGGSMSKATVIQLKFGDLKWEEISQKSGTLVKRVDVKDLN